MPDEEGLALHRAGLAAGRSRAGPFLEIGHVLREVRCLPRRGGTGDRLASYSASTTIAALWSSKRAGPTMTQRSSTRRPGGWTRCHGHGGPSSRPVSSPTWCWSWVSRRRWRGHGWRLCRCCSSTVAMVKRWRGPTTGAGCPNWPAAGRWRSMTCSRPREEGGQVPYRLYEDSVRARGASSHWPRSGTLADVVAATSLTASLTGQLDQPAPGRQRWSPHVRSRPRFPRQRVRRQSQLKENSLRVALLVYRGNPRSGGQGVYTRFLSRELARLGHVTVFSGQPWPVLDGGHDDGHGDADGDGGAPPVSRLVKVPEPRPVPRARPLPSAPAPKEIRDLVDLLEVATMLSGGSPSPAPSACEQGGRSPRAGRVRHRARQPVLRYRAARPHATTAGPSSAPATTP